MSFPRYPKYKDSSVEWLPEIPVDWHTTQAKHVTTFTTGWTPPTGDASSFEGDNLWANISDLGPRWLTDTSKRVSEAAIQKSRIRVSPKGSLLFSFKLSIGQVSFAARDMYTNEAIATFLPSPHIDLAFAYYAFPRILVQNAEENIYGAKLLNQELLRTAKIALPDMATQAAIASFLDRETAKIDELVAEQQRLMELLKEKRQAVISHAVTKGLNPDAPMKPSGVEWLGEVPAHWEVRRIRTISSFTTSGPRGWSDRMADEGALFIQSGDLDDSIGVSFATAKRVQVADDAEADRTRLEDGDVVVCITGAKTGNVAVCVTVPELAFINQHLCLIRPRDVVLPPFLGLVLKSTIGQTYFQLAQYGLKQGLSLEDVRDAPVPLPSINEQQEIVTFFGTVSDGFAMFSNEAAHAVELLHERRSALISAAVTGQIDVRKLATTEAAT